jgi:hypothetical protein
LKDLLTMPKDKSTEASKKRRSRLPDGAITAKPAHWPVWWKWFFAAMVCYFAGKALFFALTIGPDIVPDETTHFGKCLIFAKSLWLPDDSPETYHLGLIGHTANLYYFLMGKLLVVNFTPLSDLLFLRLINVLMGVATVWLAQRWVRLFNLGKLAELLFLIMLTNTLMFTFLTAGVSRDNLVNLLAVATLFSLFSWFNSRELRHLLLFVSWICLGVMTKTTFFPFAAATILVFLVHDRRSLMVLAGEV